MIMVLGGLVVAGCAVDINKPEFASATTPLAVAILLGAASVAGGRYLNRKGWQRGHGVANLMAVVPVALLVAMYTIGGIRLATQPKPDAYGYTPAAHQQMVSACGGGARCECAFNVMEHAVPYDQFEAAYDARTDSLSPEMTARITQVVQKSNC